MVSVDTPGSTNSAAVRRELAREQQIAIERQRAEERARAEARARASARLLEEIQQGSTARPKSVPGITALSTTTVHGDYIDFGTTSGYLTSEKIRLSPTDTTSTKKSDGSTVISNRDGHVVAVEYANGQKRQFGYDSQGDLNSITQLDGSVFTFKNGTWLTSNGTDTGITAAAVNMAGVYSFETAQGQIVTNDTNGQTAKRDLNTELPATLSAEAAKKAAQELRAAIHNQGFWGASADSNKAFNILQPLNQTDMKAVETAYQQMYGQNDNNALLNDMRRNFGDQQYRQAQAMLDRQNGRTNDAGNVMVALSLANSDSTKGNALLRQTFEQLNTLQIQQLKVDFQKDYGESLAQAIAKNKSVSSDTLKALPILEKGIDNRTAADDITLAKLAVQNNDLNLFGESLNGDSLAAQQARKELQADKAFLSQFEQAFTEAKPATYGRFGQTSAAETPNWNNTNQVAKDFLTEGTISLATIARGDTGHVMGFLNNDGNLSLAATNASQTERQQYAEGMQLAASNQKPSNQTEQQALSYYNQIHQAFENGGSPLQASIWQDQLLHGRDTVITQLASAHDGGFGPFHWNAHTDTNQLLNAVENLSQQDWQLLHDTKTRQQFMGEIQASLSTYASNEQSNEVMSMLRQKADASTYHSSQDVKRSLSAFIESNAGNGQSIDQHLTAMTAQDAHRYQTDAKYRTEVDSFINKNLSGDQRTYAQMMLAHVFQTGQPPKPTAPESTLADTINGASNSQTYADIRLALSDSNFRAMMNKPDGQLNTQDLAIKNALTAGLFNAAKSLCQVTTSGRFATNYASQNSSEFQQNILKPMLQTGKLGPAVEIQMGLPKSDVYPDIAAASPADQKAALALLNDNEKEIALNVIKQKGNMDLADQIQSYLVGDGGSYQDFKGSLSAMNSVQLDALKSEFAKKYGTDLDQAFLGKVSAADQQTYTNLLTTASQDGRQDFYNNLLKTNFSGFSPDGTQLTAEKATQLEQSALAQYQSQYKKLPPELQQKLDQYFGTAMEQYKASKEKLAEIAVDATITAAALAAAPFSGGLSLTAIAAIAAGGAAYRVAAMKIIEGHDFNGSPENVLKQVVIGGTSAALNFIGPGLFTAEGPLSSLAVDAVAGVATKALITAGGNALKDVGRTALSDLVKTGLQKGELDSQALQAFLATELPDVTPAARSAAESAIRAAFQTQLKEYTAHLTQTATEQAEAGVKRQYGNAPSNQPGYASNLIKTAGQNAAVGAGANVVSNLVVAPFSPGGVDANQLLTSALTGAASGATFGIVFEGARGAISAAVRRDSAGLATTGSQEPPGAPASDASPRSASNDVGIRADGSTPPGETPPSPNYTGKEDPLELAGASAAGKPAEFFDRWRGKLREFGQALVDGLQPVNAITTAPRWQLTIDGHTVPTNTIVSVGRDTASGIRIDDPIVSANHAALWQDERGLFIRDAGSSNGTFINGVRLQPGAEINGVRLSDQPGQDWVPIRRGDRVFVSGHELSFGQRQQATYEGYINGRPIPLQVGHYYMLGRTPELGITNMDVSRQHGFLGMDEKGIYIVDGVLSGEGGSLTPSSNGIFVNGERLVPGERRYLNATDQIQLGGNGAKAEQLSLVPTEVMRPPENFLYRDPASSAATLDQSNFYATHHELSGQIRDGFELAGADRKFDRAGNTVDNPSKEERFTTVVDRPSDPELQRVIYDARQRFGSLSPLEKADHLVSYVRSLLHPHNMNEAGLDAWYRSFNDAHKGEKILLGQFIKEGKGGCTQEALLYKILGDELGIGQVTMVRGQFGPHPGLNHAWDKVTLPGQSQPLIYDARVGIAAAPQDATGVYKDGLDLYHREPPTVDIGGGITLKNGESVDVGKANIDPSAPGANQIDGMQGKIFYRDGRLYFVDNSLHGTWIDGKPVPRGVEVPITCAGKPINVIEEMVDGERRFFVTDDNPRRKGSVITFGGPHGPQLEVNLGQFSEYQKGIILVQKLQFKAVRSAANGDFANYENIIAQKMRKLHLSEADIQSAYLWMMTP